MLEMHVASDPTSGGESYFDTNLLIYALLFLLDLFLELLDRCTVWRGAICLQNLDIPGRALACPSGGNPSSCGIVRTHLSRG